MDIRVSTNGMPASHLQWMISCQSFADVFCKELNSTFFISETEFTAGFLKRKKKSKMHKRLNRTLFNGTKQDKNVRIFVGSPVFQLTYNVKTEGKKNNKQFTLLMPV